MRHCSTLLRVNSVSVGVGESTVSRCMKGVDGRLVSARTFARNVHRRSSPFLLSFADLVLS